MLDTRERASSNVDELQMTFTMFTKVELKEYINHSLVTSSEFVTIFCLIRNRHKQCWEACVKTAKLSIVNILCLMNYDTRRHVFVRPQFTL